MNQELSVTHFKFILLMEFLNHTTEKSGSSIFE
jgi:hypothetical protein